jgi:hypothetical protein
MSSPVLPTKLSTLPDKLPPISTVPSLSPEAHTDILSLLFEPSPTLSVLGGPILTHPHPSYDALIGAVGNELLPLAESDYAQDIALLDDVLSSHPRLGEKKVESALSRMEQAAMEAASSRGSGSGGAGEAAVIARHKERARLEQLNREYETAFPGLRYVYALMFSLVSCEYASEC